MVKFLFVKNTRVENKNQNDLTSDLHHDSNREFNKTSFTMMI